MASTAFVPSSRDELLRVAREFEEAAERLDKARPLQRR